MYGCCKYQQALEGVVFIEHIKSHLQPGQEVICKICGKSVMEICLGPPDVSLEEEGNDGDG